MCQPGDTAVSKTDKAPSFMREMSEQFDDTMIRKVEGIRVMRTFGKGWVRSAVSGPPDRSDI